MSDLSGIVNEQRETIDRLLAERDAIAADKAQAIEMLRRMTETAQQTSVRIRELISSNITLSEMLRTIRASGDPLNGNTPQWCENCGAPMRAIRPGEAECDWCAEREALAAELTESAKAQRRLGQQSEADGLRIVALESELAAYKEVAESQEKRAELAEKQAEDETDRATMFCEGIQRDITVLRHSHQCFVAGADHEIDELRKQCREWKARTRTWWLAAKLIATKELAGVTKTAEFTTVIGCEMTTSTLAAGLKVTKLTSELAEAHEAQRRLGQQSEADGQRIVALETELAEVKRMRDLWGQIATQWADWLTAVAVLVANDDEISVEWSDVPARVNAIKQALARSQAAVERLERLCRKWNGQLWQESCEPDSSKSAKNREAAIREAKGEDVESETDATELARTGDVLNEEERPSEDSNVQAVKQQLTERAARGLTKYGVTTERTDLALPEWLQHLQEELLDAAVYCEAVKKNADRPQPQKGNA